ncbi:MAG: S8 family serine peptidase, partial [Candidatus Woesearchaeota archaeon]
MKGDFETKRPWPEILLGVVLVTTLLLLLHTEPTITGYAVFGSSVSNVTYDVERVVLPQETYTLELEDNVIVRGIVVVGYYIASKDSSIIARLDSGTISHDLSLRSNVITGMAIGAGEIESGVIEKDLANMTLLRYGDGPYDIDNDGIVGRHGAVDYYVETNASCVLWSIVGDYVDLFCQGTVDCCDNYLLQSVDENPNYLVLDRQRAGSDRGEVLAKADDYDFSRMLPYDFTGAEERLVRLDDECLGRCNIRMETSSISIQSSAYLHIDSIVVYYDEIITDEIIDGFIDDISVRGRFIEAGLEEKIRNENVRVLVVRDESLIDDRISYEGVGVAGVIARARGMVESKIVDNQILDSLLDDDTVIGLYEDKPIEFFYDTSDYQSYHSFPEGSYGSGVRICVVDSGVDLDQIDSSVSYSVVSVDDGPFVDTVGHGTLVSRLITGLIPGAEYVFVKVDRDGVAYESDLISALELCSEYDSDVVSLSLGSGSYDGFCSAHPVSDVISELSESGMLVVAAAGNDGPGTVRMPACSPDVLSVARVDLDGELVSGSSFVQGLSVFGALGEFAGYTGTSFSSPAVSAGVSVLLSEGVGKEGAFSRIVHTGDYYENVSYSVLNVSRALLGEETNSLWDDRIVDEGEDEDGDIVFLDVSVDSVGIIPSPQAFSSEDLVGYCNASGDGNVTRFDYEWKKNGTVEYRGVYFKEGSISAGEAHSCGVRANDSRVLCWGWNRYGELGDGTTDQRENPTLTSDSSGFVSVSAGRYHSCGVRANDSRVLCWGWNRYGELGD